MGTDARGGALRRGARLWALESGRAHVLSTCFLVMAVCLIPWIVFLGWTLPPKYDAGHWNLLWIGFDVGLVAVLAYSAWAAWFRRQILASTAVVAGTLLVCDAWFDIVTSIGHRDQWLTLLTGFAVELPLALFFFWLYRRIVLTNLAEIHKRMGDGPPPRRLRDARLLSFPLLVHGGEESEPSPPARPPVAGGPDGGGPVGAPADRASNDPAP